MWNVRDYRYAGSAAEAVALLRRGPGRGRYIAGGTDLLQEMPPDCDFLVDLRGAGLAGVRRGPAGEAAPGDLVIGAATPLQQLARDPLVAAFAGGALRDAALRCGSRPVRTVATIGGNLCHGLPSADMAPVLLALDAEARIEGGPDQGRERIPLARFFLGPRRTVLGDRLLTALVLPAARAGWRVAARKWSRTAEDISLAHVAVAVDAAAGAAGAAVGEARVVLGAVAPVPLRVETAEAVLVGLGGATDPAGLRERLAEAGRLAAAAASPVADHRAGADYRRAMVAILVRRLAAELLGAPAAAVDLPDGDAGAGPGGLA